jgi:RNA polymerase sigma factor (sigma-70 family)
MGDSPEDKKPDRPLPLGVSIPVVVQCVYPAMSGRSGFRTTSWNLILAAASDPTTEARHALATLCQIYWNPVYAFIRRKGHEIERAEDLTQDFFAKLIEKNYLGDADRSRGRFRSFLLVSVKHFLANEWDRDRALKRGGGQAHVSIDTVEAERWYAPAATEDVTPEDLFERRWALSLLERVMARLRAEYTAAGKAAQFQVLQPFLNREVDETRYQDAAAQLGASAGALRMSVLRMRRKYRELLRAEIGETVETPQEIDEEIRFLLSILNN